MSLTEFAHRSKYSNGYMHSQIPPSRRQGGQWREMNDLIHRIGNAKAKTSYLDDFFELDADRSLQQLLSPKKNPTETVARSLRSPSLKKLLRPRRPWTAPERSGSSLRHKYPEAFVDFEELGQSCCDGYLSSDENYRPIGRNLMESLDRKEDRKVRNIDPSRVTKERKGVSTKSKLRPKSATSERYTKRRSPLSLVEYKLENKADLQMQLKDRINKAKSKKKEREALRERNLRDTIEKKEQRRLTNNRIKETGLRQCKMIRTMILGAALQRWLRHAPELLENHKTFKSLEEAAIKIQRLWRKDNFARKAFEVSTIKRLLKSSGWIFILYIRCSRRRLYKRRLMRNFLRCKQSRLKALEIMWALEEREVITLQEAKMIKRRRRKNALAGITRRRILSKAVVGIVNTLTKEADGLPLSAARRKKELTPKESFTIMCQFHLEDSRRSHVKRSKGPTSSLLKEIPNLTSNDAKKLLSGHGDIIDNIFNYNTERLYPLFVIYSKKHDLRTKIESFRHNPEKGMLQIQERMKIHLDYHTSSGRLLDVKNSKESGCKYRYTARTSNTQEDSNLAKKCGVRVCDIIETREHFNLIDKDSKGYISYADMESVYDLISMGSHEAYTSWKDGEVTFEPFFNFLGSEMSRKMTYSPELIIEAFDFFQRACAYPRSHSNSETGNRMKRETLLNVLQNGEERWSESKARMYLQSLKGAGFDDEEINYKPMVTKITHLWTCKKT